MPHLIYCHGNFISNKEFEKLKEILHKKMVQYGIQSSINLLTTLRMTREYLITKEKSKQAANGKLKNDQHWMDLKGSINDDLDAFVNNLLNLKQKDEEVRSFFTAKLTKEELKLVEEKNPEHMASYTWKLHADIGIEEMKKSDSKDKYLRSFCHRRTTCLTLEAKQAQSEDVNAGRM